jgi:hypothetical protein
MAEKHIHRTEGQLDEEKDESGVIDNSALSQEHPTDDEASLNEALKQNPVKMFFVRTVIKLKNRLTIIPLLLAVFSMMVLTFNIPWHAQTILLLINNKFIAVLFFVDILLSLLVVMCYLRVNSRKNTLVMRIIMLVLFYIGIAASLIIDYYFVYDAHVEMSLYNSLNKVVDSADGVIAKSLAYMNFHIVVLYITAAAAALAPILQPFSKKIRIRIK